MPSAITGTTIKARSLDIADLTNTNFLSDDDIIEYINGSLAELYDLMINSFEDYFISTDNISVVSGTESYSLPSDFYKAIKVYILINGDRHKLKRFTMEELENNNIYKYPFSRPAMYRLLGSNIYFTPEPISSGTVELWYIPEVTKISVLGDTVTFNIPVQWEEFLYLSVARKMIEREERDSTQVILRLKEVENRIERSVDERDLGEQQRIQDKRYNGYTNKYNRYIY